ncbi:MAG: DUF6502 family protein [Parvibaculaceae bacterium]|nr:DUF6502 family protein [Parvibaculaceae bacterium]
MSTQPERQIRMLGAVRSLMRPLVRGLLRHGVTLSKLEEMLRALYVDEARRELSTQGKVTQSAVSLMTGVHRKDVRRLLGGDLLEEASLDAAASEEGAQETASNGPVSPGGVSASSIGARVLMMWSGDPAYSDGHGQPLRLVRRGQAGDASFEALVQQVSKDVRPRAVFDEWHRLGLIRLEKDAGGEEQVVLQQTAFTAEPGAQERYFFFGRNLADHVAAGLQNLSGAGEPTIDQAVFYGGLTAGSVTQLKQLSRTLGEEVIRRLNREAYKLKQDDRDQEGADYRMTFGAYFYEGVRENGHQEARDD